MGSEALIKNLSKIIMEILQIYKVGIIRYMAKELVKEIGDRSREFYEFVLPPVDMYVEDGVLVIVIDMPGFEKKDIKLTLYKNILSIKAQRQETPKGEIVVKQRPNVVDKKILLPIHVKDDQEPVSSAKLSQGVLTIRIPMSQKGRQIAIE